MKVVVVQVSGLFSPMQRRSTPTSCVGHSLNQTCHDEVDLTLCFQYTAILVGICVILWVLAAFEFLTTRFSRPATPFNTLNITRIVSLLLTCI